jgi:precorrin-6B methylase 2
VVNVAVLIIRKLRGVLVRDELKWVRIRRGPAKGSVMAINLRHQLRVPFGLYEREIAGAIESLVMPGDCCYDIGAASGYYTIALARLAAPGRVIAFEPDDREREILVASVNRNMDAAASVTVLSSFVAAADDGDRTVSIDGLFGGSSVPGPDVLKIDVEGMELDVLRGAQQTLEVCRPRIILEVHSLALEQACRAFLEGMGYRIRTVDRSEWLPENRPIPHNRWLIALPTEPTARPPR